MVKLFPADADLDPLMTALVKAFDAPSHSPQSRSEEARGDAFTDLCCRLARDGFYNTDTVARKWIEDDRRRESLVWLAHAAMSGESDEIVRARESVADEFVSDCAGQYETDARIRMQEMADEDAEQAANEARI